MRTERPDRRRRRRQRLDQSLHGPTIIGGHTPDQRTEEHTQDVVISEEEKLAHEIQRLHAEYDRKLAGLQTWLDMRTTIRGKRITRRECIGLAPGQDTIVMSKLNELRAARAAQSLLGELSPYENDLFDRYQDQILELQQLRLLKELTSMPAGEA